MQHPGFFDRAGPFTLAAIAAASGAELDASFDKDFTIDDVRPLKSASSRDVSFFDNRKYRASLADTSAGACFISRGDFEKLPKGTAALISPSPYRAFARATILFYADALRSKAARFKADQHATLVHPTSDIADDAVIEPGAIIGREAIIGPGSTVCAGAVVGYRVVVGADCYLGPNSTVTHAILGSRVIIHSGVRIGQDGFGFAMGAKGHEKVPQIGRVLIRDDVEIGANTTIDRGSLLDTIVGEGTKIDNLVQIGHNVVIGRHCVIVAQSGIAGSSELGDFVVMGEHSGVLGHLYIGSGAQIAGMAHVKDDVVADARMGGTPAIPFKQWARELATIKQLSRKRPIGAKD